MTRDQWLYSVGAELACLLKVKANLDVPGYYVSVGFPKGVRGRHRAIGQCWDGSMSQDSKPHIFICPTQTDRAVDILLHELIHAALPTGTAHRGAFIDACKAVGLIRPWTATTPGEELAVTLKGIVARIGPYPHAVLSTFNLTKARVRLRLFECACAKPLKLRVAHDSIDVTCNKCGAEFEKKD